MWPNFMTETPLQQELYVCTIGISDYIGSNGGVEKGKRSHSLHSQIRCV